MQSRDDLYRTPIERLTLTVRCYNVLKREGINTVGQLAVLPERYLLGLRNFTPVAMGELKAKLEQLGLSPWDAPQSTRTRAAGSLSRHALDAAGALLPAAERDRWVEEWKGELHALGSRKARALFVMSLLFAGARKLAATLRHVWPGGKPAWPDSRGDLDADDVE
jgi:Bacterial RNA polymerase, alpha chain C terminal domain